MTEAEHQQYGWLSFSTLGSAAGSGGRTLPTAIVASDSSPSDASFSQYASALPLLPPLAAPQALGPAVAGGDPLVPLHNDDTTLLGVHGRAGRPAHCHPQAFYGREVAQPSAADVEPYEADAADPYCPQLEHWPRAAGPNGSTGGRKVRGAKKRGAA